MKDGGMISMGMSRCLTGAIFLLVFTGFQSFAWMRDADIMSSRDCISIGYNSLDSISIAAEKILDRETSIGLLHMPGKTRVGVTSGYEITYNKQFAGSKDGDWSFSWMAGAIYADAWNTGERNLTRPWLGVTASRSISDIDRIRFSFDLFNYFEYARKLDDNKEIAFSLGVQMFNLKFMF